MPSRRLQSLLFALSFITFAWFHQGGGWNQNARFAEVRALVEQGRLAIDDYMVYHPGEGRKLVRSRVEHGEFTFDGVRHQLSWGDWRNLGTAAKPDWQQLTVNDTPLDPAATMVIVGEGTCTGDVGIAPDGHFHPNKPPGTSLLAVPPYFVLYHVERWLGLDPDDWWVMNVNAWLCSALTVGLASALGVVLVLRLAAQFYPGHPAAALGAALAFGFGTTFFPFGTLMFDHNMTAVLLLASFSSARNGRPFSAGVWSGVAAVTNYLAAIPGAMFGVWLLCSRRRKEAGRSNDECGMTNDESAEPNARGNSRDEKLPRDSAFVIRHSSFVVSDQPASLRRQLRWGDALRFTLGVLPCLAVLLTYNVAAFGSPFALNTSFQNPAFKEIAPAFLGMFTVPSWFAALVITVSPWRGMFVLSPVLIAAMVCLLGRWKMKALVAERRLILGCAAFFFLINICFNGFHGGFAAGPRYLIPALPFLCIPLAAAFVRWPRATTLLAAVSIVQQSLLTVTDALNPLGVGAHAWVNRPDEWKDKLIGNSLVWRYAWPMFSQGRAWPVIDAKFEELIQKKQIELEMKVVALAVQQALLTFMDAFSPFGIETCEGMKFEGWVREQRRKLALDEQEARQRVLRGEQYPLWIAAIDGPVSSNVLGPWDGTYFQNFPAHSPATTWAAFNAGELIFPASRWSLAPLLALWIAGAIFLRRWLREPEGGTQRH